MASGKMCTSSAIRAPSFSPTVVVPMNLSLPMSAMLACWMPTTTKLSASLMVMLCPLRALTVSILPSSFSTVPRILTGGFAGAWATAVAEKTAISRAVMARIMGYLRGGWEEQLTPNGRSLFRKPRKKQARQFLGAELAAEVARPAARVPHQGIDRMLYRALGLRKALIIGFPCQPAQEHPGRQHEGKRVGKVLAGDVRRRAVLGLSHAVAFARVDRRREAEAARELRGLVRKDVAVHVGGHDDVEARGVAHQQRRHRIDQLLFIRNIGALLRNVSYFAQKQTFRDFQYVDLVHRRHLAPAGAAPARTRPPRPPARPPPGPPPPGA